MDKFIGETRESVGREVESCDVAEASSKLWRNLGDEITREVAN